MIFYQPVSRSLQHIKSELNVCLRFQSTAAKVSPAAAVAGASSTNQVCLPLQMSYMEL